MRIVVLGCGPSGLMAVHAAARLGFQDIVIVSKNRKSELFGAQYLHQAVPGVTYSEVVNITYRLNGTPEQYRRKVYGSNWDGQVSPEELIKDHEAYDIRKTYDSLWARYNGAIEHTVIAKENVKEILERFQPDLTFSTIPAPILCQSPGFHTFTAQSILASGDAPERGIKCIVSHKVRNDVLCNGLEEPSWYRIANIFGYVTCEWPLHSDSVPPKGIVSQVLKPLRNDCTCFPEIIRLGRYGKWTKGILSHQAFNDTTYFLTENS